MGISGFLPPALRDVILYCVRGASGFTGPIGSWDQGLRDGFGYDNPKLHKGLPKDPKSFKGSNFLSSREIRLAFAVQSAQGLLGQHASIRVLDFGGAGGNHFELFSRIIGTNKLDYTIVESAPMVEKYKQFETESLRWLTEIPEGTFDIVLCSASIQYTQDPLSVLGKLLGISKFLILDRLSVYNGNEHVLMKQNYFSRSTGRVSYPCWYFSEEALFSKFLNKQDTVFKWEVPEDSPWVFGKRRPNIGLLVKVRQANA